MISPESDVADLISVGRRNTVSANDTMTRVMEGQPSAILLEIRKPLGKCGRECEEWFFFILYVLFIIIGFLLLIFIFNVYFNFC